MHFQKLQHGEDSAVTLVDLVSAGLARGAATQLQIETVRIAGLGERDSEALFEWAHDYGRRHGAVLAELTTDKSRADAHRFYDRLGYGASHQGMKRSLQDE